MHLNHLASALQDGQVQGLNIITHSGLNRYAVQVLPSGATPFLLADKNKKPRFWRSLALLRTSLRRHGIVPPALQVIVAQDEVIGR